MAIYPTLDYAQQGRKGIVGPATNYLFGGGSSYPNTPNWGAGLAKRTPGEMPATVNNPSVYSWYATTPALEAPGGGVPFQPFAPPSPYTALAPQAGGPGLGAPPPGLGSPVVPQPPSFGGGLGIGRMGGRMSPTLTPPLQGALAGAGVRPGQSSGIASLPGVSSLGAYGMRPSPYGGSYQSARTVPLGMTSGVQSLRRRF